MDKYFLTENFSLEENQEGSLRQTLVSISNRTKFEIIQPAGIKIYSIFREPQPENKSMDVLKFHPAYTDISILLPGSRYFEPEKHNMGTLTDEFFTDNGCPKEIVSEVKKTGYFLQVMKPDGSNIILFPAEGFMSTFCRQLGIGKLNDGIDPMRDAYLASRLVYCEPFTLVYRTNGKYGKAFGAFSPKFGKLPQTIIWEFKECLMNKNPNISIRHWEYTHSMTHVDFCLNDKVFRVGKMRVTPGVRLSLSDIGDCSYKLRAVLYCNGGSVTLPELVQRKRSGSLDVKEMVSEFYNTCLPEIEKIQENSQMLSGIPVNNEGECIISILKKLSFGSAIGKKTALSMYGEFLENTECTRMDKILCEILKIPGRVKSRECKSCLCKVSECVGRVYTLKEFNKSNAKGKKQ